MRVQFSYALQFNEPSDETRKKISESAKGKIPWNKGICQNDGMVVMQVSKTCSMKVE